MYKERKKAYSSLFAEYSKKVTMK